jgi:hypothetical protein
MITLIKPDNETLPQPEDRISIFLGGTIEMGNSEDWQTEIYNRLKDVDDTIGFFDNIDVFNPRRDSWDSSWVQEQANPQFNGQVNWELDNIEDSDIIFFNILPDSKSPITLMEIGLCKDKGTSVIVCCPDGFYRKGNVDVICSRYGMQQYKDIDSAFGALLTEINRVGRNKKIKW